MKIATAYINEIKQTYNGRTCVSIKDATAAVKTAQVEARQETLEEVKRLHVQWGSRRFYEMLNNLINTPTPGPEEA